MSRSQPTDLAVNPATRWFEWNGEHGGVRYYDRDLKKNVEVPTPFTFVLLDELGSVRGWHDASQSGIYSNEVRDTRQDVLVVKAFKGGTLAEGLYQAIKDRVNVMGGRFTANCYIGYKSDRGLALGSIKFKGGTLGAWMEFRKAHRADLYSQAVEITGYTEGKKGRVVFRVPTFRLKALSPDSNTQAIDLDKELQAYLDVYLAKTKRDQVETVGTLADNDRDVVPTDEDHDYRTPSDIDDIDVPF
jgi:hypothetical protein